MVPTRTVVRLSTRLINQSVFVLIEDVVGENIGISVGEFKDKEILLGFSRRVAMRVNRETMTSSGFAWRLRYDSMTNVVTTEEKRPAFL